MAKLYVSGSCKTVICSSKLFKASSRKNKIKAALDNPINAELIKQLDEYIGDEYKPPKNPKFSKSVDKTVNHDNTSTEIDKTSKSESFGNAPKLSEQYGDALDAEGANAFEETHSTEANNSEEENDVSINKTNAATEVPLPYIQGTATFLDMPFVENCVSLRNLAGELKGTLNARGNTAGVNRVSVKNAGTGEVWIYYNDDINLNTVMSPVIELLNAANYQYLIFNRLARTDNAIVFTINSNDTLNHMEYINNEG